MGLKCMLLLGTYKRHTLNISRQKGEAEEVGKGWPGTEQNGLAGVQREAWVRGPPGGGVEEELEYQSS